jgi:hypothetical protein
MQAVCLVWDIDVKNWQWWLVEVVVVVLVEVRKMEGHCPKEK